MCAWAAPLPLAALWTAFTALDGRAYHLAPLLIAAAPAITARLLGLPVAHRGPVAASLIAAGALSALGAWGLIELLDRMPSATLLEGQPGGMRTETGIAIATGALLGVASARPLESAANAESSVARAGQRGMILDAGSTSPVTSWQAVANAAMRRLSPRLQRRRMTTGATEDAELVRRAQAGDRGAFEVLVARHDERLYAVVLRLTRNTHEAEEITQETFLRAWRCLDSFEGRAQFFTWLFRIGVNEAKRRLQQRRPDAATGSLEDTGIEVPDWTEAPAPRAEQHDLERALDRAIAALPPDVRLPLILRDIQGLTTTEAAAIMELGEAAFKSRLHRARMTVRAAVADYANGEDDE